MAASETYTDATHAVLLAAGISSRFGDDNKLLALIDGVPLVRGVAEQLVASRVAGVVVVTGFEAGKVRDALAGLGIQFANNPEHAEGLASSLRCGVAALPKESAGAMIVLGDMPGITTELIDNLINTFRQSGSRKIVYPTRKGGQQGNPVIWPSGYFEDLKLLTGDFGAKHLIGANEADTLEVPVDADDSLRDIDEPGDLADFS